MEDNETEGELESKQNNDYDVDVTKWLEGQVPKHRTKIDRSPNRGKYIELLLAGVTYRELVVIARDKYGEEFSTRGFCLFNGRIPEEIKNPIGRMERFVKEAPYRINEILMLEELVKKQRKRFNMSEALELKASIPLSSRSQVARDLHSMLMDLQEAKMKAGIIQKVPERVEIAGMKSVSQYNEEEKGKEMERINEKLRSVRENRKSAK